MEKEAEGCYIMFYASAAPRNLHSTCCLIRFNCFEKTPAAPPSARLVPCRGLIMAEVSPHVHLGVLACVFVFLLLLLPVLYWRSVRMHSIRGMVCQPQSWILILKCGLDLTLVILLALGTFNVALLENTQSGRDLRLAVDLLLRCSITCVASAEVWHLQHE